VGDEQAERDDEIMRRAFVPRPGGHALCHSCELWTGTEADLQLHSRVCLASYHSPPSWQCRKCAAANVAAAFECVACQLSRWPIACPARDAGCQWLGNEEDHAAISEHVQRCDCLAAISASLEMDWEPSDAAGWEAYRVCPFCASELPSDMLICDVCTAHAQQASYEAFQAQHDCLC
jgi:hypothetical protein